MENMVFGVVAIFIGAMLLTGLAPTIHTQTATNLNSTGGTLGSGAGALVNVSTTSATIYNLYDLLWGIAGMMFIVGGAFSLYKDFNGS